MRLCAIWLPQQSTHIYEQGEEGIRVSSSTNEIPRQVVLVVTQIFTSPVDDYPVQYRAWADFGDSGNESHIIASLKGFSHNTRTIRNDVARLLAGLEGADHSPRYYVTVHVAKHAHIKRAWRRASRAIRGRPGWVIATAD